jgi:hypothetical protein
MNGKFLKPLQSINCRPFGSFYLTQLTKFNEFGEINRLYSYVTQQRRFNCRGIILNVFNDAFPITEDKQLRGKIENYELIRTRKINGTPDVIEKKHNIRYRTLGHWNENRTSIRKGRAKRSTAMFTKC